MFYSHGVFQKLEELPLWVFGLLLINIIFCCGFMLEAATHDLQFFSEEYCDRIISMFYFLHQV